MTEMFYNLDLGIMPLLDMTMPTGPRLHKIAESNINPDVRQVLKKVGIDAYGSGIFYACPGWRASILHVDAHLEDSSSEWSSIAKLNYVIGEKNTYTIWADVPAEKRKLSSSTITEIGQPYQSYKISWCKNFKIYNIHGWNLFEAGVPHTALNPTKNPKWTISFMLYDSGTLNTITIEDAKNRLLEYVQKN